MAESDSGPLAAAAPNAVALLCGVLLPAIQSQGGMGAADAAADAAAAGAAAAGAGDGAGASMAEALTACGVALIHQVRPAAQLPHRTHLLRHCVGPSSLPRRVQILLSKFHLFFSAQHAPGADRVARVIVSQARAAGAVVAGATLALTCARALGQEAAAHFNCMMQALVAVLASPTSSPALVRRVLVRQRCRASRPPPHARARRRRRRWTSWSACGICMRRRSLQMSCCRHSSRCCCR